MPMKAWVKDQLVSDDIKQKVKAAGKSVGSYGYDAWGFNDETSQIAWTLIKALYEKYYRVETKGLENIPADGKALIVANHSGQIPLDAALLGYALMSNPFAPRVPRFLTELWFPTVPFFGNLLNELGAVIGDNENCLKMLQKGEAVVVFPEGDKGRGKLFRDRYQMQSFDLGFMHAAMEEQVPVIPVGIVGCEETLPSFANIKWMAKLLSLPYVPLTTPLPLPTKVRISVGEPMYFGSVIAGEFEVQHKADQVRSQIQELINSGLKERKGWFA